MKKAGLHRTGGKLRPDAGRRTAMPGAARSDRVQSDGSLAKAKHHGGWSTTGVQAAGRPAISRRMLRGAIALLGGLTLAGFLAGCSNTAKDWQGTLFQDGLLQPDVTLFTLLNDYPALKSVFLQADPGEFNVQLDASLSFHDDAAVGGLRTLERMTLDPNSSLRPVLLRLSTLINRLRTQDATAYESSLELMERIRGGDAPFLSVAIPLSHAGLNKLYREKSAGEMRDEFYQLSDDLESAETIDLLTDVENFLYKSTIQNANARAGLEKVMEALGDPTLNGDRYLKRKLVAMLGGLGDMLGQRAGFSDYRSPVDAVKQLIVNLENYNTAATGPESANVYDSQWAYSQTTLGAGKNAELKNVLVDLYQSVRNLLQPPSSYVVDSSTPILETASIRLSELGFAEDIDGVDESLGKMMELDLNGLDRDSDGSSYSVSALESLLFMLVLGDVYGYQWANTPPFSSSTPTITGHSNSGQGGVITLGDSVFALQSKIRGDDTLSLIRFLYDSRANNKVYKNGSVFLFDIDAPALMFLQGASRGPMNNVNNQSSADAIYSQTLPLVLNWVKKVIYEGYGPYYSSDMGPGANYLSAWSTDEYRITVDRLGASAGTYQIGIGGVQDPGGNGTSYSITEIPIASRQVGSREEAFYKNFQWLLYEKRFVLVIPVHAKLGASQIQHATYITVVANGLMGLMNAKPYCDYNLNTCDRDDNGRWLKSGTFIKPDIKQVADTNLVLSNTPADSVVYVEAWGYGLDGQQNFDFADEVLYGALYDSILYPQPPTLFSGLIPPALSKNAPALERLGFLTSASVSSSQTDNYWEQRNKLLPLVVALAAALDDQTDTGTGKNAYKLLTELARVVVRPYLSRGNDPVSGVSNVYNLQIYGSGASFGIRSPSMDDSDYYPDSGLRSIVSLLIENQRRYQDGLLNLVSKTNLLSDVTGMLAEFGGSDRAAGRDKLLNGLLQILDEVKVTSEAPTPAQYNIETVFTDLRDDIADYPDSRPADLEATEWDEVTDGVTFIYDILANESAYSVIPNVDGLLEVLIVANPTQAEISSMLDLVGVMLTESDGVTQSYLITDILSTDMPKLLRSSAPDARGLVGIMAGIAAPNTFGDYFLLRMRSNHSIDDVLIQLERFLASPIVQSTVPGPDNVLYSAGTLAKAIADIKAQGRKTGVGGYWFEDHWNVTEQGNTVFDSLNYIFSRKVR